ncbi:MAG: hypothetical protein ACPKPY_07210 [Nitrososphaeraceae archaeon]
MGSSKDILIDRIHELEEQVKELKESKKHIYVHETDTIWECHGELHLECQQGTVVFNLQTLFSDLPIIYEYCLKEHDKHRKYIVESLKKLK